ncbi:MAG: S8 family serine peptidase [Methanomicrobiales archaeon]|nr:S8 family serine peptidase [Methanomicrobiales archaeon]
MTKQSGYRIVSILFVVLMVAVCVMPAAAAVAAENRVTTTRLYRTTSGDRGTQEYIVGFRTEQAMKGYLKANDLKTSLKREWNRLDMILLELTPKEAKELSRQRDILFVEENHEVQLLDAPRGLNMAELGKNGRYPDLSTIIQYDGVVPEEEIQYGIRMMGAEKYHRQGYFGKGVKIGIIDTGIDYDHPDLRVAGGYSFWRRDPNYRDIVFHGTHVAGIIAAQHNGFGVAGLAPDAEIYSLAVFNPLGMASLGAIIDAIEWCMDHDIDIINMSFGSVVPSPALKDACDRAYADGILLVAAAGNAGRGDYNTVTYPARLDSVIAVSAIDASEKIASWSSRGPEVELAAPGVEILSTFTYPDYYQHTYEYLSGTSMACPHVVGLAALILGANPGMTPAEVRRRLVEFARDVGPAGRDRDFGFGIPRPDRPGSSPDSGIPIVDAGGPCRGIPGEPVSFSAAGTLDPDDNFLSYAWDFGDGSAGTGSRTSHTYRVPGDYPVTLTVKDRDGLVGTADTTAAIRAGVVRTVTLPASDMGQASPGSILLRRTIVTAGVQRGAATYGLVRFTPGPQDDTFVLSSELRLTGKSRKPTYLDGTLRAALLPSSVAGNWPGFTYPDIDRASIVPLEPSLRISPLGTTLGQGKVNTFAIPAGSMDVFQEQWTGGALAFRIALDSTKASNSYTWEKPELTIRFVESVSTANMAPVAHAGYDRRVKEGTVVVLDGSASYDPEDAPLTYEWIQVKGTPVELGPVAGNPAAATFAAPEGNDVLEFELRVRDQDHAATDRVTIYLNSAKAEIHTLVLTPGPGKSGFVTEEYPDLNFFQSRDITAGPLPRERKPGEATTWGEVSTCGALQFDLSGIPPGSQITAASLELTGNRFTPDANRGYDVRVVSPELDPLWSSLNWDTFSTAPTVATLSPHIAFRDLKEDRINRLNLDPALLEARRATTGLVTLRIDGPPLRTYWRNWYAWWSGNDPLYQAKAPRLILTFSARDALQGAGSG